jgi:hypothetical protein
MLFLLFANLGMVLDPLTRALDYPEVCSRQSSKVLGRFSRRDVAARKTRLWNVFSQNTLQVRHDLCPLPADQVSHQAHPVRRGGWNPSISSRNCYREIITGLRFVNFLTRK